MYICEICDRSFNKICNYKRHQQRKISCYPLLKCPHCSKTYKCKSIFNRHYNPNSRCYIRNLELDNRELKLDKKELEFDLKNEKLKNQSVQNIDNSTNNSNNYNNCNNTNNTINQTLNLNYFGKEDTSYITPQMIQKCLRMGAQGDIDLFKKIHFHPDHPHNHNISYKNNKLKVAIGKNKSGNIVWEIKDQEAVTREHVGTSYDLCLADMQFRGVGKVSKEEIVCLRYRGEPTHRYIGIVKDGIFKN